MAVTKRWWTKGNTLTPLGAQLKAKDTTGKYVPVDLTGLTVKFHMVNDAGVDVVAETTVGVTVLDAEEGEVAFDFSAEHVATTGTHWAWFNVYSGTELDTYPMNGRTFQIEITERV